MSCSALVQLIKPLAGDNLIKQTKKDTHL